MRVATQSIVMAVLCAYTMFAAGPFVWAAMLSLRTTSEIQAGSSPPTAALRVKTVKSES